MLMTQYPKPASITPQGEELLRVLRDNGRWMNRAQLAQAVGKPELNKWDVGLLIKMADDGLIEARKEPRPGAIGYEWVYRAKQAE